MNEPIWDRRYKEFGESAQSPYTAEMHAAIGGLIPGDVRSILDAGCGGGSLMAFLARKGDYRLEGIDLSPEGVAHVVEALHMKAQVGDVTDLSRFADGAFDLVVCSEVLEHLPAEAAARAVRELARVARRYLLVTNPYRERLDYHAVRCAGCGTRFHPAGHVHSVDESFIAALVSPVAESVTFAYSGRRDWCSPRYAEFLRTRGYTLLDLGAACPACGTRATFRKWTPLVRAGGHLYRACQRLRKFLGASRPANLITFVKVKRAP